MAANLAPKVQAFLAGQDLSASQYRLVKWDATNDEILLCGNGEKPMGVLLNAPAEGFQAEVAVQGGAKVKVLSSVTVGDSVASQASGIGRTAVSGEWALGTFQDSGVSGDVVPVIIDLHQLDA